MCRASPFCVFPKAGFFSTQLSSNARRGGSQTLTLFSAARIQHLLSDTFSASRRVFLQPLFDTSEVMPHRNSFACILAPHLRHPLVSRLLLWERLLFFSSLLSLSVRRAALITRSRHSFVSMTPSSAVFSSVGQVLHPQIIIGDLVPGLFHSASRHLTFPPLPEFTLGLEREFFACLPANLRSDNNVPLSKPPLKDARHGLVNPEKTILQCPPR